MLGFQNKPSYCVTWQILQADEEQESLYKVGH